MWSHLLLPARGQRKQKLELEVQLCHELSCPVTAWGWPQQPLTTLPQAQSSCFHFFHSLSELTGLHLFRFVLDSVSMSCHVSYAYRQLQKYIKGKAVEKHTK